VVKRSAAYRRLRCHLAAPCPDDVWADGARDAFALFSLRPDVAWGTHLAFAVDRIHAEVTRLRTLQLTDEMVRGREVTLPPCAASTREMTPAAARREVQIVTL
jgi:hypothetical protein